MKYLKQLMYLRQGFTLMEILMVVLIIGILGAIALPQYQRALLKSRYAALMPIAKSMADSNEAYYLEHGIYADDPQDLLIQGQSRYTDDTELEFGTVSDYAYVLAKNEDKIPNNTFVVYQKHSGEFPGEIHCEALADNDLAESVCKSFGGNESIGKTLTDGYETYVLFGTGNGVAPTGDNGGEEPEEPTCPDNSVCDEEGDVTGCANGYVLNGTTCEQEPECEGEQPQASQACAIGSGTMTRTLTCANNTWSAGGWNTSGCSVTAAEAQAFANEHCRYTASKGTGCVGIANNDGTVSVCENYTGSVNSTGECMYNDNSHQLGPFETVYNPDGTRKSEIQCVGGLGTRGVDMHCTDTALFTYNPDGSYLYQARACANWDGANKDLTCPNNAYINAYDKYFDPQNNIRTSNKCSAVASNGECTAYGEMLASDYTYTNGNKTGQVNKTCLSISETTCENNNYKPYSASIKVEGSSNNRVIQCYNSNGGSSSTINADGSCPSGYTWQQKDPDGTYKACSGGDQPTGIDWETVTCS